MVARAFKRRRNKATGTERQEQVHPTAVNGKGVSMKQLVAVLVVAAMLVAGQSAAYAMAKKPNCDGTYGNASSPNYKYQFNQAKSGGAWNFDGTFNYRLDAEGNPIPNPVGVTTFTDGGRTMLCNGKPVTEYGVMCYDPNKVSYNEPEWLKCAGFKK